MEKPDAEPPREAPLPKNEASGEAPDDSSSSGGNTEQEPSSQPLRDPSPPKKDTEETPRNASSPGGNTEQDKSLEPPRASPPPEAEASQKAAPSSSSSGDDDAKQPDAEPLRASPPAPSANANPSQDAANDPSSSLNDGTSKTAGEPQRAPSPPPSTTTPRSKDAAPASSSFPSDAAKKATAEPQGAPAPLEMKATTQPAFKLSADMFSPDMFSSKSSAPQNIKNKSQQSPLRDLALPQAKKNEQAVQKSSQAGPKINTNFGGGANQPEMRHFGTNEAAGTQQAAPKTPAPTAPVMPEASQPALPPIFNFKTKEPAQKFKPIDSNFGGGPALTTGEGGMKLFGAKGTDGPKETAQKSPEPGPTTLDEGGMKRSGVKDTNGAQETARKSPGPGPTTLGEAGMKRLGVKNTDGSQEIARKSSGVLNLFSYKQAELRFPQKTASDGSGTQQPAQTPSVPSQRTSDQPKAETNDSGANQETAPKRIKKPVSQHRRTTATNGGTFYSPENRDKISRDAVKAGQEDNGEEVSEEE